jgi:hypothetical protein
LADYADYRLKLFQMFIIAGCRSRINGFDMSVAANASLKDRQKFKLVCEQCGSLTVALPIEPQPGPCSVLKCGRCGSPRGTLQSLRDASIQVDVGQTV